MQILEIAIAQAISDREKMVRIAGIDLLGKANVSPVVMVKLLSDVINTKSTEEKQAALLTLGKLPVALSGRVINAQLDKMAAGTLSPEVYIELSEAIDSTHDASWYRSIKKSVPVYRLMNSLRRMPEVYMAAILTRDVRYFSMVRPRNASVVIPTMTMAAMPVRG